MTMANPLPERQYLLECFSYEAETGSLTWRKRPIEHFSSSSRQKQFNSAFGGKRAGSIATVSVSAGRQYRIVRLNGVLFYAHRVAYKLATGEEPLVIDHIDGDTLNNKLTNLRTCTTADNSRNVKIRETNKSGCTGVSWTERKQRWRAYITVGARQIALGTYRRFEDAVRARKAAEKIYGFHPNHGTR